MILWLLGLWPHLNLVAALAGGAMFGGLGLLMLALWVPGYDGDPYAKGSIEFGYQCFGIALGVLLLGAAAFAVVLAALAVGLGVVVVRSVGIVRS